jgi:hypothetical protein
VGWMGRHKGGRVREFKPAKEERPLRFSIVQASWQGTDHGGPPITDGKAGTIVPIQETNTLHLTRKAP